MMSLMLSDLIHLDYLTKNHAVTFKIHTVLTSKTHLKQCQFRQHSYTQI